MKYITMTTYAYDLEDVMTNNLKYAWNTQDLWDASSKLNVVTLRISDVKHWIYKPCWSIGSKDECFISPYQVLLQPKRFPEHIKRINASDTTYPLIIMDDKYDKYGTILDGNHRFAKLIIDGKKVVKVVYLSRSKLDKLKVKV